MAFEQKNDDFILSPNKFKKEDKHPAYTGTIMLDGVKYRLAAWIKKGEDGVAFFTGKKSEMKAEHQEQADDPLNPTTPSQEPQIMMPALEPDDLPF